MHLSCPAAQEVIQAERNRKRPSTDPGARSPKAWNASGEEISEEKNNAGAVEIARAFKDWVRF